MSEPNAILRQVVNPAEIFSERSITGALGWILCETVGQSLRFWSEELEQTNGLHLIGDVRGVDKQKQRDYFALEPLLAQLSENLGDPHYYRESVRPGVLDGAGYFKTLRELVSLKAADERAVVVIRNPESLDSGSCEVLTRLALNDDIRLFIHTSTFASLPRKWRLMHESGNLATCPEGKVGVHEIGRLLSTVIGYQIPWIGAVALHHATNGRAGQLDLLLESVEPSILRAVLFTGGTEQLPVIVRILTLLKTRRSAMGEQAELLLGLCAILSHVPLDVAHALFGRATIDLVLATELTTRRVCGTRQIISMASPLLERHWNEILSAFERVELEELAARVELCCQKGLPDTVASLLARGEKPELEVAITALNITSESPNSTKSESTAEFVRDILPRIGDATQGTRATVAVARSSYVTNGSHAALRELKRGALHHPGLWTEDETAQLLVQICLETGRLLPTVQRVAKMRGLAMPVVRDDPLMLKLLPSDALSRCLELGLQAAQQGDVRRAAVHLISGLRRTYIDPFGGNSVALRGTLLSASGICLAMGGYAREWLELSELLHKKPRPWHARSVAALELSQGLRELQQGKLVSGGTRIETAAQSAIMIDAEAVHSSLQEIDQVLKRFAQFPVLENAEQHSGIQRSVVTDGRKKLEDIATAGLLRDPAIQKLVLDEALTLADPRAHALAIGARSQLGLCDPMEAIKSLTSLDQGFAAAWVADGILMHKVFAHAGPAAIAAAHTKFPHSPMDIVKALLAPLGNSPIPGVDRELNTLVGVFEPQALSSLPFLAHEVRARRLTVRENEILNLARSGMNNREIAKDLTLSIRTVEGHVAAVLEKLCLPRRDDLMTI